MKFVFTAVFFVISFVNGFSQRNDLDFNTLDNTGGLPQNSVYAITQDSLGFVWIGTEDGLVRYDGNDVVLFNKSNKKYSNLFSNSIYTLFCKWPYIWIGTEKGLNSYNIISEKIVKYYNDKEFAIEINSITYEPDENKIWVGTNKGLYSRSCIDTTNIIFDERMKSSINDLVYYKRGIVLATDNGLFYRPNELNRIDTISLLSFKKIKSNEKGSIFVLSSNNIVYSLSNTLDSITFYTELPDKKAEVTDFCFYNDKILLSTKNMGVYYNNNWNKYSGIESRGLSENNIICNFIDNTGILWIGTYTKGICWDDSRMNFAKHYTSSASEKNNHFFLPGNIVWCFEQIDSDKVAIGLEESGIAIFNIKESSFERISSSYSDLDNSTVKAMSLIDSTLYLGNNKGIIYSFNQKQDVRIQARLRSDEEIKVINSLGPNKIAVGTNKSLYFFSLTQHEIDTVKIENVYCIEKGILKNTIYVGTKGSGLYLVNTEKCTITKISEEALKILSIYRPKYNPNVLLVGTKDSGLLEFNLITNEYEDAPLIQDKEANVIHSLLVKSDTSIWVSTNNGIYLYNYIRKNYKCLSNLSNLQNREYCGGSSFIDSGGNLFFGGVNGFSMLNYNAFKAFVDNQDEITSYISNFYSVSNDSTFRNSFSLDSNVIVKHFFDIKYTDRPVLFEINTIDFSNALLEHEVSLVDNGDTNIISPINGKNIYSINYSVNDNLLLLFTHVNIELLIVTKNNRGLPFSYSKKKFAIRISHASYWYVIVLIGCLLLILLIVFIIVKVIHKLKRNTILSAKETNHLRDIDEIKNIANQSSLINLAIEKLVADYAFSSVVYLDFSMAKNELIPNCQDSAISSSSKSLIFYFKELLQSNHITLDLSGAGCFKVRSNNIIKNEIVKFGDKIIFPCYAINDLNEGNQMVHGICGIFIADRSYSDGFGMKDFSVLRKAISIKLNTKYKDSLYYATSLLKIISQTLISIKNNNIISEIDTKIGEIKFDILNSNSEDKYILLIESIIIFLKNKFTALSFIGIEIPAFGLQDDSNSFLLPRNSKNNYTSHFEERIPIVYKEVGVFEVCIFSETNFNSNLIHYITIFFKKAVEPFYNIKYDYFIGKLIRPFRLFDTYQSNITESRLNHDEMVIEPFINLLRLYFYSDFISLWIKKFDNNENTVCYVQEFVTEPLKVNTATQMGKIAAINYNREYCPHVIDLSNRTLLNEQFYDVAKSNMFLSCIYVPLLLDKNVQYGYILIFSKRKLRSILITKDIDFLWYISAKFAIFIQDRKLINYKNSIDISKFTSLTDSLEQLLIDARNYLFADFVSLLWYGDKGNSVLVFSGQDNLPEVSNSQKYSNKNSIKKEIELLRGSMSVGKDLIWISDTKSFIEQFGKKLNKVNKFPSDLDYRNFYNNKIKTSIATIIKSNEKILGILIIKFTKFCFKQNDENEYLIKSFVRHIVEGVDRANYYDLYKQKQLIANLKAKYESEKSRLLEIKFEDVESKRMEIEEKLIATLSKFSDYSQYLMFRTIYHDVGRILGAQRDSLKSISTNRLSDRDKAVFDGEIKRVDLNAQRIRDFLKLFNYTEKGEVEIETELDFEKIISALKNYFIRPYLYIERVDPEQKVEISIKNLAVGQDKNDKIPLFYGKKTLISMVFYNLISNAIDALFTLEDKKDKKIEIIIDFRSNTYIIDVNDNGPGLNKYKVNETSIFDYGNTTKENGLGIGLYFVQYVITKKYSGTIRYKRKNNLTQFRVQIPRK